MTTDTGPGRPPVGPMIAVRMPAALVARLDDHAKETGTTRSELLRRYARDGLAADERDGP